MQNTQIFGAKECTGLDRITYDVQVFIAVILHRKFPLPLQLIYSVQKTYLFQNMNEVFCFPM